MKSIQFLLFITVCASTNAQNIDNVVYMSWLNGNWQNTSRQNYSYDVNGFQTSSNQQTWNFQNSSWIDQSQTLNTFDLNGKIFESITQTWESNTNSWKNSSKSNHTYVGNSNSIVVYQTWINNLWRNWLKQNNTYDANNQMQSSLEQVWENTQSLWRNSRQTVYINNPNGTISEYTNQSWDTIANSWKNSLRATYMYNSSNLLTITYQIWNNNLWQNWLKQSFSYDSQGFQISNTQELWNQSSNTWTNNSRTSNFNSSDGRILSYETQSWNSQTNLWVNSSKAVYEYNTIINSNSRITYKKLSTYPNPFTSEVKISLQSMEKSEVTISTSNGNTVDFRILNENENRIQLIHLQPGVYIITVRQNGIVWTNQMIKIPE